MRLVATTLDVRALKDLVMEAQRFWLDVWLWINWDAWARRGWFLNVWLRGWTLRPKQERQGVKPGGGWSVKPRPGCITARRDLLPGDYTTHMSFSAQHLAGLRLPGN